jgi:hypothetical protein
MVHKMPLLPLAEWRENGYIKEARLIEALYEPRKY